MPTCALNVLFEDNHLLAVNKPAGLATMGVAPDRPSLLSVAKEYIKHKYHKPGNVYLGIVSRLDAPVTGVVLIARTSKAARRLTEQFKFGDVKKVYWAIVGGFPRPNAATLQTWLRKDERHRKVHVCEQGSVGAKKAVLMYRTMERFEHTSQLEIELKTGRKHQIRVQMAHQSHPIVGDRKYGSRMEFDNGIALHSQKLEFEHPVRRTPIELVAPLPEAWEKFCVNQD